MNIENIFPVGIGTFRINLNNKEESMSALLESFNLGQNYIDTSHLYENGKVMAFLGGFIHNVGRNNIFITTKIEPTVEKITDIECQLDKYLSIMNLQYIDCLMLHSVIFTKLPLTETYKEMNRMVKIGKAKCLGLSNSTLEQLQKIHNLYPISIYEGVYNLENKIYENLGVIEFCKENNIKYFAYQPLRRNRTANRNYDILIKLSNKYGKSQNQIILNWIIKEKKIGVLIKSTNLDRIKANISSLDFEMEEGDYQSLNEFRSKEFDNLEIDWEGNGGVTIDQVANQFD